MPENEPALCRQACSESSNFMLLAAKEAWCPSYGGCFGHGLRCEFGGSPLASPLLQPNRFYVVEIHAEVLARESVRVMAQLRTRLKQTVAHSLPGEDSF